jgi:hypothetical protein
VAIVADKLFINKKEKLNIHRVTPYAEPTTLIWSPRYEEFESQDCRGQLTLKKKKEHE